MTNIETIMEPLAKGLFPDDTLRRNKYLAAARQLIQLRLQLQLQPDLSSRDIYDRADSLLDKAMSSLAMEFCQVRIWRLDSHLDISPASIWESVSRNCGSGSCSTASWQSSCGSFSSTSGSLNDCSFNVYHADLSLCEDMFVRSGKSLSVIDRESLSL